MLIVQVCDFGEDGDARYRVHDPSIALGELPGVSVIDCHFLSRELPELAQKADVLVLQFVMDWEITGVCLQRRAAGKITIFEANDYFFDLQPWNPIFKPWQDYNVQELYLKLLELCDGVQTTTEVLADHWRQRGAKNVAVFPNQLTRIDPLSEINPRPLTIGWAGSPAHLADLYNIAPRLQRWLNANPDVHLAIMTADTARPFFDLPPERYHFESFASLDAYLRFLRRIDIGLAPLLPTEYNRCRSDVKFLEYATQGVVGIYANLEPYSGVENGRTGFLAANTGEMIDHLDRLRGDNALRAAIRRQAYAQVQHRLLSSHIPDRLNWYRTMAGSAPAADKGYSQRLPDDAAKTVRGATALPAAQASPAIAKVLDSHPSYLAALQHQGRLLNDLRRGEEALKTLQKALAIQSQSARTLSEMGRSLYWLNRNTESIEALNQAIAVNPHYLPAWQYLLRMLDISKDPSLAKRAADAARYFPNCYPLAILGAHNATRLMEILNNVAPGLNDRNRSTALAAFRPAILARPDLDLLRRACEIFPESPTLSAALGDALERAGRHVEARTHFVRALCLKQQAETANGESGSGSTPLKWQLADHIRSVEP